MKILLALVIKNLKMIFRNPLVVILLIGAPMLLMFVVGVTFSGETLVDTRVGAIHFEDNTLDLSGIQIIQYNKRDIIYDRDKCIEDLKKSKVDLCFSLLTHKNDVGEIQSADVTYYIDNTREKISSILIRIFDRKLNEKTKEISTNAVSVIFDEIDNSILFMKDSKDLVDKIHTDLKSSNANLNYFMKDFDNEKIVFEKKLDLLESTLLNVDISTQVLDNNLKTLQKTNAAITSTLINGIDDVEYSINDLEDLSNDLVILGLYEQASKVDQISFDLSSVMSDLLQLETSLEVSNGQIDQVLENVGDFEINDEVYDGLNEIKIQLDSASDNLILLKNGLDEKETEVGQIAKTIDDKLNYFEQLSNKDAREITEPIKETKLPLFNDFKTVHYMASTIVVVVALFITMILSNVIISLEKDSPASFRNYLLPVKYGKFIFALYITILLLVLLQVFFLLLILVFFFGIDVFSNTSGIFIALFHYITFFILLGILISYLFKSVQVSMIVSTFLVLFFFLLSNVVYPMKLMPQTLYYIFLFNPLVITEKIIRTLFYFDLFIISFKEFLFIYVSYIVLIILIYLIIKIKR